MATTQADVMFPYGTSSTDQTFSECYERDYSRARSYALPDRLPNHHLLLSNLEGSYLLEYTLPPWWQECAAQVPWDLLKPLLAEVSAQEFRAGCIEQARWKAFRETLSEEDRHQLPTSPKIGALIGYTDWQVRFSERGPTTTPDQLTLSISTRPLDMLYMSNGRDWTSCQHFREGSENHQLPGNFYDTNLALATILAPNVCVQEQASVLARTTLRLFPHQGQLVITVGRTYHNNETLALLLLRQLANLFDARQIAWGFMTAVNSFSYCQDGSLGTDLFQSLGQTVRVGGSSCWFPRHWFTPYIDGGENAWKHRGLSSNGDYSCAQLNATICLMRPRMGSQSPLPTSHIPAQ